MDSGQTVVFAWKVMHEGAESCRGGRSVKKKKSTRMCSYALENEKYFRACGGGRYHKMQRRCAPFSAKCNSEKPREMFVIGIVGSCSLGSTPFKRERKKRGKRACSLFARVRAGPRTLLRYASEFYFVRAPCIRIK